jgi:acetyl esterase/lipase
VLLYCHGGVFVVELAFNPVYHGYLNALAAKAGVITVSVNYSLAAEHSLLAAYDYSWMELPLPRHLHAFSTLVGLGIFV